MYVLRKVALYVAKLLRIPFSTLQKTLERASQEVYLLDPTLGLLKFIGTRFFMRSLALLGAGHLFAAIVAWPFTNGVSVVVTDIIIASIAVFHSLVHRFKFSIYFYERLLRYA